MENIIITKKINNRNITFEYGQFVQNLGLQLRKQCNNKYLLKDSAYWSELVKGTFDLFKNDLILKEELDRIINGLDIKVRENIKENPTQMKIKYKTLSELLPKWNVKKKEEIRKEIFNKVENMYFNEHLKQIEIARELKLEPKSVNYIVRQLDKN